MESKSKKKVKKYDSEFVQGVADIVDGLIILRRVLVGMKKAMAAAEKKRSRKSGRPKNKTIDGEAIVISSKIKG